MRSGGSSFISWAIAIITASVGVPVTQKRRSPSFLNRTGLLRVSEWPEPDCSSVGATTQISSEKPRAIVSSSLRPVAFTPSSLVSRMRIAAEPMAAGPERGKARRGAEPPGQPRSGCRVDLPHKKETEIRVPHNSFVLVDDGKKSIHFRTEGAGDIHL